MQRGNESFLCIDGNNQRIIPVLIQKGDLPDHHRPQDASILNTLYAFQVPAPYRIDNGKDSTFYGSESVIRRCAKLGEPGIHIAVGIPSPGLLILIPVRPLVNPELKSVPTPDRPQRCRAAFQATLEATRIIDRMVLLQRHGAYLLHRPVSKELRPYLIKKVNFRHIPSPFQA